MKKYYAHFTLLLLVVSQMSCQEKKQSFETDKSLVGDSTLISPSELDNSSPFFRSVLKTNAGMVRGLSLGDDFATIKESAPLSEAQPDNGKSFTENFDDMGLNFVDIKYLKNIDNKVSVISVDIFVEKQSSVDSLMSEFKSYFENKYGTGKGITKMMVWKLPDGLNVLKLQNVSTAKDPGLKIVFAKSGDEMLQ